MRVFGRLPYTGDEEAPFVTVTLSAIEALNLECAVRSWMRWLDGPFFADAEAMLLQLKDINKGSED